MDEDLGPMSREQLVEEVRQELCWHHPALWGLLPEKTDPVPTVPDWPQFIQGCVKYRLSLDEQAPNAPRTSEPPPR